MPFFWLGDTAWSIHINLDRQETIEYLDNRAAKGFTVIQTSLLFTPSGDNGPNRQDDSPFDGGIANLVETPGEDPNDDAQYDYWDHVEFMVKEAAARNMYVAIMPSWSNNSAGEDLTAQNAEAYGTFLGKRLGARHGNIIWLMGGDDRNFFPEIWRPLARGITIGTAGSEDYGKTFITYHPAGGLNSATEFNGEPWLDFNMYQSGHEKFDLNTDIPKNVDVSLEANPPRPFLDGEPTYEEHPFNFEAAQGYADVVEVRESAYDQVFSGAGGHTYGHHNVWTFYGTPLGGGGQQMKAIDWRTALDHPGAQQIGNLRKLADSRARPGVFRVPDQRLLASGATEAGNRLLRGSDSSYLMVYSRLGAAITVDTGSISGDALTAHWFDPRTGQAEPIADVKRDTAATFTPPANGRGNDWVLVVDDAAKQYGKPGAAA